MGLRRRPWSREEDKVLIDFITTHGHENWRALPKLTGLSRCGRSCRFRWLNYLRPDIKRGNFSNEEDEEIIKLHDMLGNRWSAIAARFPRRTDNEIKNVWNTRLKKKLNKFNTTTPESKCETSDSVDILSPPQSTSEFSCGTDSSSSVVSVSGYSSCTVDKQGTSTNDEYYVSTADQNFSTDYLVEENLDMLAEFSPSTETDTQQQTNADMGFWLELYSKNQGEKSNVSANVSLSTEIDTQKQTCFSPYRSNMNDNTDFWLDLYLNARGQPVSESKSMAEGWIDNPDFWA